MKNKKHITAGILILIVVIILISTLQKSAPDTKEVSVKEDVSNTDIADEVVVDGEMVKYMPNDQVTQGYFVSPDGAAAGQTPALILIHEWWGLNEDIKSIADDFADQGYAVLAVDMYAGEEATDPGQARELSSAVRDNVEGAFVNLQNAVDFLSARPEVDPSSLASVGWCFGGQWAYQMALNNLGVNASVMYYGQFNPDDDFTMMKSDILGHFGEEDAVIAIDDVKEFQANLATANGDHSVYIYPNVGHGFANLREGTNMSYDPEASELAWSRTLEFLEEKLK